MAVYLKKGIMGVYTETDYDSCEIVGLRLSDYNRNRQNYSIMEKEIDKLIKENASRLSEAEKGYKDRISALEKQNQQIKDEMNKRLSEASERIKVMQKELEDASRTAEEEIEHNSELRRICRERSNAQRGLRPKTTHPGYIVISEKQYTQSFIREYNNLSEWHENHGEYEPFKSKETFVDICWKTVMQTPYDAGTTFGFAFNEIDRDFRTLTVISDLGISGVDTEKGYTYEMHKSEECFVYRIEYAANCRSGYWEVTIYHSKALTIPESYRQYSKPAKVDSEKKRGAGARSGKKTAGSVQKQQTAAHEESAANGYVIINGERFETYEDDDEDDYDFDDEYEWYDEDADL